MKLRRKGSLPGFHVSTGVDSHSSPCIRTSRRASYLRRNSNPINNYKTQTVSPCEFSLLQPMLPYSSRCTCTPDIPSIILHYAPFLSVSLSMSLYPPKSSIAPPARCDESQTPTPCPSNGTQPPGQRTHGRSGASCPRCQRHRGT